MLQVRYFKFTYIVVAWILLESNDFEYWFLHKDKLFPFIILLQHNLFFSLILFQMRLSLINIYVCIHWSQNIQYPMLKNEKHWIWMVQHENESKIHFAAMLHIKWLYHCVDASACVFTGRQFDKGISATLFSI